jgi:hypothetical protein
VINAFGFAFKTGCDNPGRHCHTWPAAPPGRQGTPSPRELAEAEGESLAAAFLGARTVADGDPLGGGEVEERRWGGLGGGGSMVSLLSRLREGL